MPATSGPADWDALIAAGVDAIISDDPGELIRYLRSTHEICDRNRDVATASLIETWIDETERRTWFLSETERQL